MDGRKSYCAACAECQRRKQKCNRQFPCNHCVKRGVAHLCRAVLRAPSSKTNRSSPSLDDASSSSGSRKRNIDVSQDEDTSPELVEYSDIENSSFDASNALSALGYMPHTHHLVLGRGNGPMAGNDSIDDIEQRGPSEELKAALKQVPLKSHTDCLVDNWLNGANYHYYALYPPVFRTQYDGWWTSPASNQTPELTSLILRVCACSALFLADGCVKDRLESEFKEDALTFANRMHQAAEALSGSIQHGKGGLPHVQQLFLTAFWFRSAEKWTEAWYALSAAVRAGFEIGLHQDSSSDGMSEFDREMRRRVWCVLYLWDFALSSMLSRPMIINRADCAFEMPTLALEVDPKEPYEPSPFRHMKLHCQLCFDMSREIASAPLEKEGTGLAPRLRDVVERWFESLPDEYAVMGPDDRWDGDHDWVVFQRRYLHLIGYMSLFRFLKPYVTRSSAEPMSEPDRELRSAGVEAALALMDASWSLFETVASTGAKFHYSVFCIFDTTTVLCSAFVHDEVRNLPQRDNVLGAIKKGLSMLEGLRSVSKTTADLCRILHGRLMNLPLSPREKGLVGVAKRAKPDAPPPRHGNTRSPRFPKSPLSQETNAAEIQSETASEIDGTADTTPAGSGDSDVDISDGSQSTLSQSPNDTEASSSPSYQVNDFPPAQASPGTGGPPPHEQHPNSIGLRNISDPPDGISHINMSPGPFVAQSGLVLAGNAAQLDSFQYNSSQPASFGTMPMGERGWQPSVTMVNERRSFQNPNLVAFAPTIPTVMEYWDWQDLDLSHPGFWGNNPPSM